MRFSRKSNKPFNAGASTLYFLYCYIFTGMLFCVFWGASFLSPTLTTGANACGPYMSAAAGAFDTLKTEASADADVFKVLFDFFLEPRVGRAPRSISPPCAARALVLAEFVGADAGEPLDDALLQQRLRKAEKGVTSRGRSRGGSARNTAARTQESVADDAGWKSGGEG